MERDSNGYSAIKASFEDKVFFVLSFIFFAVSAVLSSTLDALPHKGTPSIWGAGIAISCAFAWPWWLSSAWNRNVPRLWGGIRLTYWDASGVIVLLTLLAVVWS